MRLIVVLKIALARHVGKHSDLRDATKMVADKPAPQSLIGDVLHARPPDRHGSAEVALRLLSGHHFDVVLVDIALPGMSGIEMARLADEALAGRQIVFALAFGYLVADRCNFCCTNLSILYRFGKSSTSSALSVSELAGIAPAGFPGGSLSIILRTSAPLFMAREHSSSGLF